MFLAIWNKLILTCFILNILKINYKGILCSFFIIFVKTIMGNSDKYGEISDKNYFIISRVLYKYISNIDMCLKLKTRFNLYILAMTPTYVMFLF